jgi:hypothetical protein
VSINPGLPNDDGYSNSDWKTLDTLENLPDAIQLAQGLTQKNPKQFVGIWAANGKSAGFYWPGQGWRGLKEGVSAGSENLGTIPTTEFVKGIYSLAAEYGNQAPDPDAVKKMMVLAPNQEVDLQKTFQKVIAAFQAQLPQIQQMMKELDELIKTAEQPGVSEGSKRKKKKTSRALGRYFFPGYGYYGSGESGGGSGDGGESINRGMAETRMSAAQRLSNAWDKQRAKSDASLRRTPSSIPKSMPEPKKPDTEPKTVSESRVKRRALMAQMLNGQ